MEQLDDERLEYADAITSENLLKRSSS